MYRLQGNWRVAGSDTSSDLVESSRPLLARSRSGLFASSDQPVGTSLPSNRKPWTYHVYSIWLFTYSDLKTIIVPKTSFGLLNALAAHAFAITSGLESVQVLFRAPLVLIWTWSNLLPFAIDNQRQPGSIIEDRANKPWRTLPSGRLTPTQAKYLMFPLYVVAGIYSVLIGGWRQSLTLMALGWWYNDLGGADDSWISRNLINGAGFACYATGAMEVALGTPVPLIGSLGSWATLLIAVVFTTVHTQDMYDQDGDGLRGRVTLPLAVGDGMARYVTAFWMLVWIGVCPRYWGLPFLPWVSYAALGSTVLMRTLRKRSVPDDKKTFRLWNLWMVFTYTLPLISLFCQQQQVEVYANPG